MQSVQRFIIFSRIAEKQSDWVCQDFSGKKVKDREGACRQHLVIRIPTDDIHLLLFQNANGQDFGWVKATMHMHTFVRFDKGNLYGCGVNGKVCGLLRGVIEQLGLPTARISVLDHADERGTQEGTCDSERVQES